MWKLLGINDDVTTCECCGKSNLKCTVVLTNGDGEVCYGRDCAARALLPVVAGRTVGKPKTANKIEQLARNASTGVKPKQSKPYWSVSEMRAK